MATLIPSFASHTNLFLKHHLALDCEADAELVPRNMQLGDGRSNTDQILLHHKFKDRNWHLGWDQQHSYFVVFPLPYAPTALWGRRYLVSCRLCSPHLISAQNGRKCGEGPESDSPNVELFQYIVGFESLPQGSCSTVVKTIVGNIQHLEEYVCL